MNVGTWFGVHQRVFRPSIVRSAALISIRNYAHDIPDEIDKRLEERLRDKSRLKPWVRSLMLNEESTPPPALFDYQITVQYKRKLYAKFGHKSGIEPGIMWPSEDELRLIKEKEQELETPLPAMLEEVENEKKREKEYRIHREQQIEKQMAKLNTWMKELSDRRARKISDAMAVKQKKEKLIEEVRQYFGFKLDPKDPKFQEVLEKKEKEERKALKEAKKKEKLAKEMARLTALAQQSISSAPSPAEDASASKPTENKLTNEDK